MALISLMGLFGGRTFERAGFALYSSAVRAAREPYYYEALEVPDTLDGRFDMIGSFVVLLIGRLRREAKPGPEVAQAVFDAMFSDMDHTLREMGVSDMTVGRKVKAMWEALHGRGEAYAGPLESGDRAGLAAALDRNVWRGAAPAGAADALAGSMLRQKAALDEQGLAALQAGQVRFAPGAAVLA